MCLSSVSMKILFQIIPIWEWRPTELIALGTLQVAVRRRTRNAWRAALKTQRRCDGTKAG